MPLRVLLASQSPRRHELLARVLDEFEIHPADIDERPAPGEAPDDLVIRLASEKAAAISTEDSITIAADTIVVLDGEILGKPTDDQEAASMLRRLSGRSHEVVSGVAVVRRVGSDDPIVHADIERSVVTMSVLDQPLVDWYLATGEGADKAGAYGLQGRGAVFADRVDGSVSNVVGLPLPLLLGLLRRAGIVLGTGESAS